MKPVHGYIKTTINGTTYLLPYGQQIADHHPGIRLNASGSLLWDALCAGADEEKLLNILMHHYHAEEADLPIMKKDLKRYLQMLAQNRLLEPEESAVTHPFDDEFFFRIGPLTFAFHGIKSLFPSGFSDFCCSPTHPDQTILLHYKKPDTQRNGTILVRNEHVFIAEDETAYILIYPETSRIKEVHIEKDGTKTHIYCIPPFDEKLTQAIFHATRFSFLVLAQLHGLFVLHSASLLYGDKAWLFSGKSGTGKSTHTNFWQTSFGTPVLNGDLNVIAIENGIPVVYGIPWCGTSNLFTAQTYPLGGIVFLKQDKENHWLVPAEDEKTLFLSQRMISPSWNPVLLQKNLSFSEALVKTTPVFRLFCKKDPSAAWLIKEAIDHLKQ